MASELGSLPYCVSILSQSFKNWVTSSPENFTASALFGRGMIGRIFSIIARLASNMTIMLFSIALFISPSAGLVSAGVSERRLVLLEEGASVIVPCWIWMWMWWWV